MSKMNPIYQYLSNDTYFLMGANGEVLEKANNLFEGIPLATMRYQSLGYQKFWGICDSQGFLIEKNFDGYRYPEDIPEIHIR